MDNISIKGKQSFDPTTVIDSSSQENKSLISTLKDKSISNEFKAAILKAALKNCSTPSKIIELLKALKDAGCYPLPVRVSAKVIPSATGALNSNRKKISKETKTEIIVSNTLLRPKKNNRHN